MHIYYKSHPAAFIYICVFTCIQSAFNILRQVLSPKVILFMLLNNYLANCCRRYVCAQLPLRRKWQFCNTVHQCGKKNWLVMGIRVCAYKNFRGLYCPWRTVSPRKTWKAESTMIGLLFMIHVREESANSIFRLSRHLSFSGLWCWLNFAPLIQLNLICLNH